MINNYKNLIKIFLVLVFVYLISIFLIKDIFMAYSPKIRPNLGSYFLAKINKTKKNILAKLNFNFNLFPSFNIPSSNNIASNQNQEEIVNFLKSSLKPISKGVSAATKGNYSYTQFRLNEIEWVQISYTLKNGRVINIEYPKGTNPPPREIYE